MTTGGCRGGTAAAMKSRKLSFIDFWKSKKERGALLRRANQLKLRPSQIGRLLADSEVRAAIQNGKMASLLPPVGTEVFRRFTPASLAAIQDRHEAKEIERKRRKKNKEVAEDDLSKPAADLEEGKPLPFIYGDPPPELLYTPLEELDPYYQSQKTFIVLSKGNVLHRFNAERSCYLLSPFSPLRTVAIKILIHSFFSLFIMMTLLTNCVFMAMSDPPTWSRIVEYMFIAVYTFETIVKVASRGFCVGKFTFLRDPWSWLDVIVVTTAYLIMFVDLGRFSVLWMVPRTLKLLAVIPVSGLKTTVRALVQSVKSLAGVTVLASLCLSIFAVMALHLFMGSLKRRCVMTQSYKDEDVTYSHYDNKTGSSGYNTHFFPGLLCGNKFDAEICPEGFVCMIGERNPNYGFTNYDSFGWSLLSLFRLMTQDFRENLVQMTLQAEGKSYLIFFVLVFPGCLCLLSLVLAVVAMASGEQEAADVTEAKQKELEFSQILKVLKRREEEEQAASRAVLSEEQEGESRQSQERRSTAVGESEEDQRTCLLGWFVFTDLLLKWNCYCCWWRLKQRLYTFITNPFFDLGIVVCLVLNTVFMAVDHHPMTEGFYWQLMVAHLVFTTIFLAEMILKLLALGPYGYFQVGWNVFDSIVVAVSLLELFLFSYWLKALLLMRVLRLARWWPSLHMLLKFIWTSVKALRNLILVLLVMVFIFTIVGIQLFSKDYRDNVCRIAVDCSLPRWHMNDFFHALLIIVRVMFGEWIETTWDCMEVSGQTICLIFFIMVLVIGKLLILTLFLNLLLSSVISDSLVAPEEKENNLQIAIGLIKKAVACNKTCILGCIRTLQGKKDNVNQYHRAVDRMEENRKVYLDLTLVTSDQPVSEAHTESQRVPTAEIEFKRPENEEELKKQQCDGVQKHPEVQQDEDDEARKGSTPEDCCSDKCYRCCPFLNIDTSQGSGRVWSNVRRAGFSIVQHKYFEIFIIFIILLSSGSLIVEDIHLQHRQVLKTVVEKADQVFTFLFLLEMLLKWIAFGLKKYFTDAWCQLDFLILDVSLVSLSADMLGFSQVGAIQTLRTLRALGPLRALSRFRGLRLAVETVVRTVCSAWNMLLVFMVVWLIFSIVGVDLFAARFYHCFNETSEESFSPSVVDNKTDCFSLINENNTEASWRNTKFNFDSVLSGFLSLLVLATSRLWTDIMNAAVDAREVNFQPEYEANLQMYLFYFCFIITTFFTFNLFVRVIIDNLLRDKSGKKPVFMTEEQQKFVKKLFLEKPQHPVPRPQNHCLALLFDLVTRPCFEVFMLVLICLNVVTLMVVTEEQSDQKHLILVHIHETLILIFFIEFLLKIIALRQHYFKDAFNIIDFIVITMSIVGVFRFSVTMALFPVLRVARVARILHLVPCARGTRKLLVAFMKSLPALINIGLLLFIIMFTFSIFGMFNFAYVKKEEEINNMFNFETFEKSIACMFMVTTSGWAGLLRPLMNSPPDCNPSMENPGSTVTGDCVNPSVAIGFFASYILLTILLVVHLYIAVILETFSSGDAEILCEDDLQMFYKTWRDFDPDASQCIQYSELSDFCNTLQDPLRIPKPNTIRLIHMDLPLLPGDKIHCVDVLLALATQVSSDPGETDSLKARMEEHLKIDTSKVSYEPISSTLQRKQEEVAASVIQRAYRKRLLQHGDANGTALDSVGVSCGVSGSSRPGGALE